jgi:hypothetical protein
VIRTDKLKNRTIYAYLKCPAAEEVDWESAIHKNWHFLFRKPNRRMLFSYLSDKMESLDKFQFYPDLARSLDNRLNSFKRNCERVKQVKAKIRLNKKKLELLKTLGYIR